MAGPSIMVRVLGDLTGLSKSVGKAGDTAQSASSKIHGAFSSVLGQLNSAGVLGPFGESLASVDEAFSKIAEHGKGVGQAMIGVGGALAGVGLGLQALGSKDQAAHQQLQQAVEATGKSYDDYEKQVESAIKSQERFGHSAAETQDALRILTSATNDPAKALKYLGTASDLAAAKHESLSEAATGLGKVYNGNTKLLKEFGLEAGTKASTATKALESATKQATTADTAAQAAKQHLLDLQARLTGGNKAEVISTAGVTAAQERLSAAQQRLTQLEAIDATKKKLTIAQQFALQNAHEAVTRATQGVTAAQDKYAAAQATAVNKTHLTVAQQQELRNAEAKVVTSAAAAQAAHKKLADAQTAAGKAAHSQTDTMTALSQKLHGQASAAADTFTGRLDALKTKFEDSAATIGQKYGPAITAAGAGLSVLGTVTTTATAVVTKITEAQKAAKAATEAATAATEAGTVATDAATVSEGLALAPILLVIAALAVLGAAAYLIYRNWGTIWKAMKAAVVDVWDWIKANWPLLVGILLGPIALAAALIWKYWAYIKQGFDTAIAGIKAAWNAFVGWFVGLGGDIAKVAAGMWHGIADAFNVAIYAVRSTWNTVWGWITGLPGAIAGALGNMWYGMYDAFRNVLDDIIDLWNRLHFTLPKVSFLGKSIGGETIGVPRIPHLAQGGLMTASGIVYAHAGEVISPAPAAARGGPAVVVNNAHFSTEVDLEAFMRRAAWVARTQGV